MKIDITFKNLSEIQEIKNNHPNGHLKSRAGRVYWIFTESHSGTQEARNIGIRENGEINKPTAQHLTKLRGTAQKFLNPVPENSNVLKGGSD